MVGDVAEVQVAVHERGRDVVRRAAGRAAARPRAGSRAGRRELVGVEQPQLGAVGEHVAVRGKSCGSSPRSGHPAARSCAACATQSSCMPAIAPGCRCGEPGRRVVLVGDSRPAAPSAASRGPAGRPSSSGTRPGSSRARRSVMRGSDRKWSHVAFKITDPSLGGDAQHGRQAPHLHRDARLRCGGGRARQGSRSTQASASARHGRREPLLPAGRQWRAAQVGGHGRAHGCRRWYAGSSDVGERRPTA